jgi:hypothetical protein
MNNFPKNSYQDNNSKNRMSGLSPTPINNIFPNQKTDPNSFLTESVQNINQFRYSTDLTLSRGIVNDNSITRKIFNNKMFLYSNINQINSKTLLEDKEMHYKMMLSLFPKMKYCPRINYIKKVKEDETEEDVRIKIIAQNYEISEREALFLLSSLD